MSNSDLIDIEKPTLELFIKAAADKIGVGGCPMCQQYFMSFYLLRQRGLVDLIVTTSVPEAPAPEVLEFTNGRHYPAAKFLYEEYEENTQSDDRMKKISKTIECETVSELADLLSKLQSLSDKEDQQINGLNFENLYTKFKLFLKSSSGTNVSTSINPNSNPMVYILKSLEQLDQELYEKSEYYLYNSNRELNFLDCNLIPVLQHIRVAGKAYRDFEIPTEFYAIWKYLSCIYNTEVMDVCCPSDSEIILHYGGFDRAGKRIAIDPKKRKDRTFSVPSKVIKQFEMELEDD